MNTAAAAFPYSHHTSHITSKKNVSRAQTAASFGGYSHWTAACDKLLFGIETGALRTVSLYLFKTRTTSPGNQKGPATGFLVKLAPWIGSLTQPCRPELRFRHLMQLRMLSGRAHVTCCRRLLEPECRGIRAKLSFAALSMERSMASHGFFGNTVCLSIK